jgi:signal transduction histidine kinase
MSKKVFKWIGNLLPFILIIAFASLLIYATWHLIHLPYDGMDWSRINGLVRSVEPDSPAFNMVRPGDVILQIEGVPSSRSAEVYATLHSGDDIHLSILRNGQVIQKELHLIPAAESELFHRLAPLIVAFAFLIIGIIVKGFAPSSTSTNLFFFLCLFGSGILSSGSISARGPEWTSGLFILLLWWIGPLAVHLHLHFPESRSSSLRRTLHIPLYLFAMIGCLPYAIIGPYQLQSSILDRILYFAGRFFLVFNLLLVIMLLITSYIRATSARSRQQIRLVTLFSVISLLLVISLTILPGAILLQPIFPYETSFLFLLFIPLAYSYAIVRYRLIRLERFLNRGAAYVLVFSILIAIYLGIIAIIEIALPFSIHEKPILCLLLMLPLAISFEPMRNHLQQFVDWVFYGGWYDYRSAIRKITQGLEETTDARSLGEVLCQRLKDTLRLNEAFLVLIEADGSIMIHPPPGNSNPGYLRAPYALDQLLLPQSCALIQFFLKHSSPIHTNELKRALKNSPLTNWEQSLMDDIPGKLTAPILGNNRLLGLLLIEPKTGREVFSSEDYDILAVVCRQVGISLQNIQLLDELRYRAAEVNQLHKEIMRTREEERKRLARELHDEIIQALVGLNFRLSQLDTLHLSPMRDEVREIIYDLRRICSELRPTTLDNLGLVSAIRSRIRELAGANHKSIEFDFSVLGDEDQPIPEDIALCLYRVLNEALNNAIKHAQARQVEVEIEIRYDAVILSVKDDGRGFLIPHPLGKLLDDQHFGLVGMREQIEHFQGELEIQSRPNEGTCIVASIPIKPPTEL